MRIDQNLMFMFWAGGIGDPDQFIYDLRREIEAWNLNLKALIYFNAPVGIEVSLTSLSMEPEYVLEDYLQGIRLLQPQSSDGPLFWVVEKWNWFYYEPEDESLYFLREKLLRNEWSV